MHRWRDRLCAHREGSCHRQRQKQSASRKMQESSNDDQSPYVRKLFLDGGVCWKGAPAAVTPNAVGGKQSATPLCLIPRVRNGREGIQIFLSGDDWLGLGRHPNSRKCANGLGLFGHLCARRWYTYSVGRIQAKEGASR